MGRTIGELAALAGAELVGDGDCEIHSVATLAEAGPGSISFLANRRYQRYLRETRASAVILDRAHLADSPCPALVSEHPYLTYARVAALLHPTPQPDPGIHASAVIAADARLDASVSVGPGSVVEARAVLEAGVVLGPNCVVGEDCRIGARTRLVASVTLCPRSRLGADCLLHPGVVIGSDGFGMANDQGAWVKVPQVGGVHIGNDVEIGANTTVDRGAIGDTVIGDGVKLDNQIQIGHNVSIGRHTAIAACTGISGSTRIGEYCTLAGAVGVAGHLELADHVHVLAMSGVSGHLREPGVYAGVPPVLPHREWSRNFTRLKQLDQLVRRVRALEAELAALQRDDD